jgi:hypothetical protein
MLFLASTKQSSVFPFREGNLSDWYYGWNPEALKGKGRDRPR